MPQCDGPLRKDEGSGPSCTPDFYTGPERYRQVSHSALTANLREAAFVKGKRNGVPVSRKRVKGASQAQRGVGPTRGGTNRRPSVVSAFDSCGLLGGRTELPVVITYGKV